MTSTCSPSPRTARGVAAALLLWGGAVTLLAAEGAFLAIPMPAIAGLVAAGIAAPTAAGLFVPAVRDWLGALGLRPLTLLHVWRIPAALAFFAYGLSGMLPTAFWVLAGAGDLIAGLLAARFFAGPATLREYRRFHAFGFADFVVAVGTGLTFTLLGDPRMETIAVLPMALIPLFGVGLSGASHILAFRLIAGAGRGVAPYGAEPAIGGSAFR